MIFAVLSAIVVAEVWLLWKARALVHRDHGTELGSLIERQGRDIRLRAGLGHFPDWPAYESELDRIFYAVDERLRVLASAALAAGMGATILSLMVHFFFDIGASGELDIRQVLTSLPIALIGSFVGVVVHLIITVWMLPGFERNFDETRSLAIDRLREISGQSPPIETLAETINRIPSTLGQLLEASISQALVQLPSVVEAMGTKVEALAGLVDSQSSSLSNATASMEVSARSMAESRQALAPGLQQLGSTFQEIQSFPERVAHTLASEREAWSTDLQHQHDQKWQQLQTLLVNMQVAAEKRDREMVQGVAMIAEACRGLAGDIDALIERLVPDLGRHFGRQAADHVRQMAQHIESERESLFERIEGHEQQWRNNVGKVVRELQEGALQPIRDDLVPRLSSLGEDLQGISTVLAQASAGLAESHSAWKSSQSETLEGWRAASAEIASAAKAFGEGDSQLERAVNLLAQRSEGMEGLIRQQEQFSDRLLEALGQVTKQHLEGWEPLRQETSKLVSALNNERLEHRKVLQQLARMIEDLLKSGSMGSPALEPPKPREIRAERKVSA